MESDPQLPVSRDDLVQTIAHGLRFEGRKRIHHADDFMAHAAAEKLVDHLLRCGYIVTHKPPTPAHSAPTYTPNPHLTK